MRHASRVAGAMGWACAQGACPPDTLAKVLHKDCNEISETEKMTPFKITDLRLLEPLCVMAESPRDAAGYLVACLHRLMGQTPMIECDVEPASNTFDCTGEGALEAGRRGFAWEGGEGWSVYDPLGEHA